ncbi:hypothetical protein BAC2_00625 [uncultured bacterium]|nr:hypothetical protein BAC2_00625 [uncultured bacterium]
MSKGIRGRFSREAWAALGLRVQQEGRGRSVSEFREWVGRVAEELDQHLARRDWTLWEAYEWMCASVEVPRSGRQRDDELDDTVSETEDIAPTVTPNDPLDKVKDDGYGDDWVAKRMAEYEAFYSRISPNDRASLTDLVQAERNIARLNVRLTAEMSARLPDPVSVKNYQDALSRASQQSRALQTMLHIDRESREKEAAQSSDADKALGTVDAAGAWYEEFATPIIHRGCRASKLPGASDILFGTILWDFEELPARVEVRCPKCGEWVGVELKPTEQALVETTEPPWVAEEEAAGVL